MERPVILLASGSAIRADILRQAGVRFEIQKPDTDEAAIKRAAIEDGAGLEETAMMLAEAKCLSVMRQVKTSPSDTLVIGSDQIMEFEGRAYDKPASIGEARTRLMELQGKAHTLINAIAVARNGSVIWRNIERPKLTIRSLTETEIDAYLTAAGSDILHSVGAYQVEKLGARLFERIEGDYFAVLGLTIFPLLDILRREGALEF
jgi:nucleoside triphosphate pyrophosphatase